MGHYRDKLLTINQGRRVIRYRRPVKGETITMVRTVKAYRSDGNHSEIKVGAESKSALVRKVHGIYGPFDESGLVNDDKARGLKFEGFRTMHGGVTVKVIIEDL